MLRKLFVVVDCADDKEKEAVQAAFNELSNMRVLSGRQIVSMYPFFRQRKAELMELFGMIRDGGAKALLSLRGATLLSQLTKK